MKKKFLAVFLVFIVVLPSILPLFRSDFFRMHDYTHVARLHQLDKALKDGHFPPRWAKDLGWGYGMPLFNFYAPLPYYLGEVFHLLGFSFLNSIKIVFALTFFISFTGMFFLAKKFWGKWAGFLAAVAFVYSPYRAVDFYVRGALGELFGIALLPWAVWAIFQLIEKKKIKFLLISSFILATLFLSHTVLTLISFPFLLLISFFYLFLCSQKKKAFFYLLASFLLGLGLSLFFLLPAYLEKQFTRVFTLTQGFSHYSHHFLYFRQFVYGNWGYGGSVDSIPDLMSFHLGKGHLFLAFLTLGLVFLSFIQEKKIKKKTLIVGFFTSLILLLAFLATYHAQPVWDALPLMVYIQFPWRLNSLIIVLLAFLAGGGCFYLQKRINKKIVFLFLLGSVLGLLKINSRYFRPEKYLDPQKHYYADEKSLKKSMSGIIPDYVPLWVEKDPSEIALEDYRIIEGSLDIEVKESRTNRLLLQTSSSQPVKLQLNRFYFPGWQLFLDNQKIDFSYKNNNGIIKTSLPAGKHQLVLAFKRTKVRFWSEIASLVSLLILAVLGGKIAKKKIF